MRIVFVSHYAVPHIGGIESVVDALARTMSARGHHVTHLASATPEDGVADGPQTDYEVVRVPALNVFERWFGLPYPLHQPMRLMKALDRTLQGADVIHAHGILYQSCATAFRMCGRRPAPVRVLTEHVGHVPYANPVLDLTERFALGSVGRATARRAHVILTLNERVSRLISRLAPDVDVVRVLNGVDFRMFQPADPQEKDRLRRGLGWDTTPRVLFVGRFVEKKGVRIAIEATRLAGGQFELVLVGPGTPPPGSQYVTCLGSQSRERLAELYRAADLLVLPSHGEGFPLVVQEAMASGTPVVLSDDPAHTAVIKGSGNGCLCVPATAGAVVEAVLGLLRSPGAGSMAHAFARRSFDWEATVDQHLALYRHYAERARLLDDNAL